MTQRVSFTPLAAEWIDKLRAQHGPLMFHQSGGCCDGSAPMCYPVEELYLDDNDVLLGEVHGCKFYMSRSQFAYWKHTHLTLDVTEGRGSSFSVEIPHGVRFVIKSRLLTEGELMALRIQEA